jgi:hypothetical protein
MRVNENGQIISYREPVLEHAKADAPPIRDMLKRDVLGEAVGRDVFLVPYYSRAEIGADSNTQTWLDRFAA